MKPGRTAQPEQSMTSSAVRSTSPTATIRASSTRRSPDTRRRFSSWVMMRPPRSRRDIGRPSMGRAVERVFAASEPIEVKKTRAANPRNGKSLADASPCAHVDVDFSKALRECLDQVGPGHVATCGAIARALGDIRAARSVATWLNTHPDTAGSHRVVRADGRPVLASASSELEREGIQLSRGRVSSERIVDALEPVGLLSALREEQRILSDRVVEEDTGPQFDRIAGVDAGYEGDAMYVVATCLDLKDLNPIDITAVRHHADFPYIPTYLAYREFPGIEAAVRRLNRRPDVLLVDGHGRLHPALFGIACYVGVRLDLPTIGVAKHPLVGRVTKRGHPPSGAMAIEFQGRVRVDPSGPRATDLCLDRTPHHARARPRGGPRVNSPRTSRTAEAR